MFSTRDIAPYMRPQYPDQPWSRRDIENEGIRAQDEAFGGYTPTQALIKLLEEHGIKHYVR